MSEWTNSIQTGDCFDVLGELPESSVHMCMTSPPYYGLRDYDVDGQIGLEETLDEYIDRLVRVGDDLRRVLRDDGSWWLNLGDSYATSPSGNGGFSNSDEYEAASGMAVGMAEFQRKQKQLVPHRVVIALQESGWVVRNDVTWVKPNPMPQSVKDRLNTTTEQIFHLTPAPDYWYDLDAIREPHATKQTPNTDSYDRSENNAEKGAGAKHELHPDGAHPAGKNPGDVFEVTTKPFPDAHFAVYPPELCEKPIKATCPPRVCVECGAPYERVVNVHDDWKEHGEVDPHKEDAQQHAAENQTGSSSRLYRDHGGGGFTKATREFKGWRQTCDCATDATESGICLDPFAGAGTTLLKAKELGRRFVGIELNPEYADMARARIGLTPEDPARVRSDDAQQGLEAFADGGGRDE